VGVRSPYHLINKRIGIHSSMSSVLVMELLFKISSNFKPLSNVQLILSVKNRNSGRNSGCGQKKM